MKKSTIITAALVCILLTVSFAGVITSYGLIQENRILKEQLEKPKNQQLTLAFHVCDKGEGYDYARFLNASYTYNQIQALNNNTFQILLLPEYKGHANWTEEQKWIADNFGGPQSIPIMLDVFGGGSQSPPPPMLSKEQIHQTLSQENVKCIRFAEVISWHIENHKAFPTDYVKSIFSFCRENNLKVFWTEWKNDFPEKNVETFTAIKNYTQGYEDIVTVSFSTNSQELTPADAFLKLNSMFPQWGSSIQSWYWNTTLNKNLMDMPPSLLLEHSFIAKDLGAKIIQYEPYWYFFDNGEPNSNLQVILKNLVDAENKQG
jgi:hypothetical protein